MTEESFRDQLDRQIRLAVKHFWSTRESQSRNQGKQGGRDRGNRTAVTGGAQLDGFLNVFQWLCSQAGIETDRKSTRLNSSHYS